MSAPTVPLNMTREGFAVTIATKSANSPAIIESIYFVPGSLTLPDIASRIAREDTYPAASVTYLSGNPPKEPAHWLAYMDDAIQGTGYRRTSDAKLWTAPDGRMYGIFRIAVAD